MRLRAIVGAAAAGALAVGCASVAPPAAEPIRGRLSLTVDAAGPEPSRGFNAAFELVGDARAGELRLSTVLGPRLASARWDDDGAVLDQGDRTRRFDSLESLSREVLGEPVPLRALPDWLAGRPWPGAPSAASAAPGGGFEQLGWRIDLARWPEGFVAATRASPPPRVTLRVRLERG